VQAGELAARLTELKEEAADLQRRNEQEQVLMQDENRRHQSALHDIRRRHGLELIHLSST
jgi:hypothetical protein